MSTPAAQRLTAARNASRDWGYRLGGFQHVSICLLDADVRAIDAEVERRRAAGQFAASRANVAASLIRLGLTCLAEADGEDRL